MALASFVYRLFCSSKKQQAVFAESKEVAISPLMKYLVTGLGNIGPEYTRTRHNMGFMVLDQWIDKDQDAMFKTERYGDVACIKYKGRQFWLLKPSTYMNLSGNAVRYWMEKLGIPRQNLIVICDDLNLPFGTTRMKLQGSDGGHNGLKHISQLLGDDSYTRIRIGIGNDFSKGEQIDFVLGKLSEDEIASIPEIADKLISGIKIYAFEGPEKAMNAINTRKKQGKS